MKWMAVCAFFVLFSSRLFAQSKYFVFFTDKKDTQFDPYSYFDPSAILRRERQHLPLCDSTDFPLNISYVAAVTALSDSVDVESRWFNALSVYATEDELAEIEMLPFVLKTEPLDPIPVICGVHDNTQPLDHDTKALLRFQLSRHDASAFRDAGITGKGVRIAILDVGFYLVNQHPAFAHIRNRDHIIKTWDFTRKREDVYVGWDHGTSVLSCIGGFYDTIPMGMATDAEFLLARVENIFREQFSGDYTVSEDHWIAASEWADKNGADIINSSMAYTWPYKPTQLDGKTTLITQAAEKASQKGILVVNAAGNDASHMWEYIAAPADGPDVLTVGGVDPYTDAHIEFSSLGPTADGRLKPDVSSLGRAVTVSSSGYSIEEGTSFATPLVAGFAACVWQLHRDWTNTQVKDSIERSAHLYPYYDYAHGYGIPQADYFMHGPQKIDSTFCIDTMHSDSTFLFVDLKKDWYPENDTAHVYRTRNLYYEFVDAGGEVAWYAVIVPETSLQVLAIPEKISKNPGAYSVRMHFEGYTAAYKLK